MQLQQQLFFFFLCFGIISTQAQVTENQAAAIQLAKEKNKAILLVFSGSDWCQPCIRFEKNVLHNEAFMSFVEEELVVLKCDFPQRKKLDKAIVQQNEALAEAFNEKGDFPKLLLLDKEFNKLVDINYNGQPVINFVQQIESHLPLKIINQEYRKKVSLMGSFFEFVLVAPNHEAEDAWNNINACIEEAKRIEALISEWQPNSEISQINQNAGNAATKVSPEVYQLLERSLAISKLTQGAFDLTFLAYYDYWKFDNSQTFPFDTSAIKRLASRVDYTKVELQEDAKVYIPKGFKLGVGGIGQGYAVDKIKALLLERGVENFVINSSGDVYAHGKRADGSPWKVGIASPIDKDKIVKWLPVSNFAVVTSGTSEKNFEYNKEIYGHIINPKTGFPVKGLQSVTILSEFTEVADALATSILILGPEIGLDLINQMPKTHCIIIDSAQKVHYSDDLEIKN